MIVGETYNDRVTITDVDGIPASAGTVTADVTLPDGADDTATVTEDEQGQYDIDYVTTLVGRHEVLVTATGGVLGSVVRKLHRIFDVEAESAGWLVSLNDVKDDLNIPAAVTDHDAELSAAIASASALVEAESKLWHRVTVVESIDPARKLYLRSTPVTSVTSVVQGGVTLTGYEISPLRNSLRATPNGSPPWTGPGAVTVTYVAGETTVPHAVRQATFLTIQEIWRAQRAASGLPLAGRSGYQDPDAAPSLAYSLPFGARQLLAPWARGPLVA